MKNNYSLLIMDLLYLEDYVHKSKSKIKNEKNGMGWNMDMIYI